MMGNHDNMIIKKKEMVLSRMKEIENVCGIFFEQKREIDYREIAVKSNIPYSTLMKQPYKGIIQKWIRTEKLNTIHSSDANMLKAEIKHLNNVIKKLMKENHVLKTEIYAKGLQ